MSVTENVVYRTLPDDSAISYRSIPRGCSGVADSLAQARVRYRNELTALLDVDRHELPPVVEHVEAKVAGLWVRSRVGAVHRDRLTDRMFLQRLLDPGELQDQIRTYAADVDAVVVLAEPEDPVASVLDQMDREDAVVVTFPDDRAGLSWTAIHGPGAGGADALPVAHVASGLRDCPIEAFAHTCVGDTRAVRLGPWDLARAS